MHTTLHLPAKWILRKTRRTATNLVPQANGLRRMRTIRSTVRATRMGQRSEIPGPNHGALATVDNSVATWFPGATWAFFRMPVDPRNPHNANSISNETSQARGNPKSLVIRLAFVVARNVFPHGVSKPEPQICSFDSNNRRKKEEDSGIGDCYHRYTRIRLSCRGA